MAIKVAKGKTMEGGRRRDVVVKGKEEWIGRNAHASVTYVA